MASDSTELSAHPYFGGPDYNSEILWITDFNFELLPVQSPLLRQSLLISFPSLNNMLKSSESSYLISGDNLKYLFISSHINVIATRSILFIWEILIHFNWLFVKAHWNKYTGLASVRYVRKSDDSWFCNSHCISHSCCVLHRYGSQDIHRWKFRFIQPF